MLGCAKCVYIFTSLRQNYVTEALFGLTFIQIFNP